MTGLVLRPARAGAGTPGRGRVALRLLCRHETGEVTLDVGEQRLLRLHRGCGCAALRRHLVEHLAGVAPRRGRGSPASRPSGGARLLQLVERILLPVGRRPGEELGASEIGQLGDAPRCRRSTGRRARRPAPRSASSPRAVLALASTLGQVGGRRLRALFDVGGAHAGLVVVLGQHAGALRQGLELAGDPGGLGSSWTRAGQPTPGRRRGRSTPQEATRSDETEAATQAVKPQSRWRATLPGAAPNWGILRRPRTVTAMTAKFRIEHDSLGEVRVPEKPRNGAPRPSGRSRTSIFPGSPSIPTLIGALARDQGRGGDGERPPEDHPAGRRQGDLAAADEIVDGRWDAEFPVDVYQTGSGTSSNMNANEVIASLATASSASPSTRTTTSTRRSRRTTCSLRPSMLRQPPRSCTPHPRLRTSPSRCARSRRSSPRSSRAGAPT